VAPVVEKGANRAALSAGRNWYDCGRVKKIAGGRWIDRAVDLTILPLYVRAGATIPLDPVRQFTAEKSVPAHHL